MKEEELVIGGKYIPISKSIGDPFPGFVWKSAQKRGQGFLYYNGKSAEGYFMFNSVFDSSGDYFLPSDLIPYVEKNEEEKSMLEHARDISIDCFRILNEDS